MNIFKRIVQSIIHPLDALKVAEGYYSYCDSCDKIISGWIGSTGDYENITRTCIPCCEKEREGLEFKFENDDKEKQRIEYNAYDKDGNKVGQTVRIAYFTEEQINRLEEVKDKLRKEGKI